MKIIKFLVICLLIQSILIIPVICKNNNYSIIDSYMCVKDSDDAIDIPDIYRKNPRNLP